MKLVFTTRKVVHFLIISVLGLTFMGVAIQISKYLLGHTYLFGLVPLFDLGTDSSIPTWYASFTLLICTILLGIIALAKKDARDPFTRHWQGLAFVFLYLSIDEVARIHEVIGDTLGRFTGETHGLLYFTWVIYGMAFVLLLIPPYIKFLRHLPHQTTKLFVSAGIVYLGGALGMEMVNARHADLYGFKNLAYQLMTAFEEFLEMTGIAIFIYALMCYIAEQHPQNISIRIEKDSRRERD